jgi:hypothetical protein
MKIAKNIVTVISMLIISATANAKDLEKAPKFKEYPVELSKTKNTSITEWSGYEDFKTRIKNAIKAKPNAAGKYIITGWGCGGGCHNYVIINKETGKVLPYSLGNYDADYDIDDNGTLPNSKLIVLRKEDTAFFNILDNDKLELIGTMPALKDEESQ